MITEAVSKFAVEFLNTAGYAGAAALMALESMIAPVPSEAVMPFVGFLVADGKWNLWVAILATSTGSVIGSLISYFIGSFGGRPLVLRVGKYLLLDEHDLALAERFFHGRGGGTAVFISRFIPIVRHLISIPAGVGHMPLPIFIVLTLVGATLWNSFLLGCGMKLREHWHVVQQYSHQIDIVVGVILIAALAWYVNRKLKKA